MEENRKIDNLFRKKVPPGEETPPEEVWKNISARLSSKEEKRPLILPFWYKVAGVAAVLLLIFSLVQQWESPVVDSPDLEHSTVETEQEKRKSHTVEEVIEESEETVDQFSSVPGTEIAETTAATEPRDKNEAENRAITGAKDRKVISPGPIDFDAKKRIAFDAVLTADKISLVNLKSPLSTSEESLLGAEETEEPVKKIEKNPSGKNRFSVSPVVAAVYFGKIGGGNAFDERLSGNSNPGQITAVYGFSFGYGISEKLKIRSGFNTVSLSSSTKGIDNALAVTAEAIDLDPAASFEIPAGIGNLNQDLKFLEIPLELEYTLVDRKFGINLITGASTFLLQDNETTLNSNVFTGPLGPANNLNRTSFSANLGLGFRYRFIPGFYLNLDPVFKYQFNMYDNVEDLQPYHFGIYSGIRFRF